MNWFVKAFHWIKDIDSNPNVKAAEKEMSALLPVAVGIMEEIVTLAPNKTLQEFNAILIKYAIPALNALSVGTKIGIEGIVIGAQILKKNHAPQADIALLHAVAAMANQVVSPTPTVIGD